ncbi:hypothetical protein HZB69_04900 [Candidatus Amesbacteria bacterium]|nr:hypothetical protein [Candidatus Amesbacteria bacterium]
MYRITELIKTGRTIFHTQDLMLLWKISNVNTLYTTVKRYIQNGVLYSVRKGIYSLIPVDKIDPVLLGPVLAHRYCYLSTESVLERAGLMPQIISGLTYVSDLSQKIIYANKVYSFRQLRPQFLYNKSGVNEENGILVATVERAVADLWYFNPKHHLDNLKQIDLIKVKKIQKEIGYE